MIKKLKPFWVELNKITDAYYKVVSDLEEDMRKKVGIKDLEFFFCDDGYYCGIGNEDRTMELIHDRELE